MRRPTSTVYALVSSPLDGQDTLAHGPRLDLRACLLITQRVCHCDFVPIADALRCFCERVGNSHPHGRVQCWAMVARLTKNDTAVCSGSSHAHFCRTRYELRADHDLRLGFDFGKDESILFSCILDMSTWEWLRCCSQRPFFAWRAIFGLRTLANRLFRLLLNLC